MKRLFEFAVVLGLLVSSVSASGSVKIEGVVSKPPAMVSGGAVMVDDVSPNPPPGSDVNPDLKATPILF